MELLDKEIVLKHILHATPYKTETETYFWELINSLPTISPREPCEAGTVDIQQRSVGMELFKLQRLDRKWKEYETIQILPVLRRSDGGLRCAIFARIMNLTRLGTKEGRTTSGSAKIVCSTMMNIWAGREWQSTSALCVDES